MLNGSTVPVPCGKCPPCKKRRISTWSFRIMQQFKKSDSAYFITLTYDTKNVPVSEAGYMQLSKRDVQLFFKSLRKAQVAANFAAGRSKDEFQYSGIKYFAVGEYGSRTLRPHYHILLFNANIELIQPAWSMGEVHYGQVSEASVGYCLKYMLKEQRAPHGSCQPYFALMSKGLGAEYLTQAMIKWHRGKLYQRAYCNIEDGKKVSMSRYYKNKIYSKDECKAIGVIALKDKKDLSFEETWNKVQSDNAAFRKQKKDADKGRSL